MKRNDIKCSWIEKVLTRICVLWENIRYMARTRKRDGRKAFFVFLCRINSEGVSRAFDFCFWKEGDGGDGGEGMTGEKLEMVDYLLANCKNGFQNKWIASNANLINTLKLLFSLNFPMLIYSPFSSHRSIACLVFLCYLIRFGLLSLHRRKSKIAKLVWQNRRGIQYSCVRVWSFIPCQIFFLCTCTDWEVAL